jgi:uncharacterized membrane protein YedE/YeeE
MVVASEEKGILAELYDNIFGKSWPMWVGAILLSMLSILLFMFYKPWGQSGGINSIGKVFMAPLIQIFDTTYIAEDFLDKPYAVLAITTFFGAMTSAFLARQYAWRIPPIGELVKGLLGGIIMGIGFVIGSGCTLGGFYSGIPSLSVGAFFFTGGLVIGTFFAVKWLNFELEKFPGISSGTTKKVDFKSDNTYIQPIMGIIVFLIGLSVLFIYVYDPSKPLYIIVIGFAFIGLFIGFVLHRSRFCIVRALREMFLSGDGSAVIAVLAGLLVSVVGFTAITFMDSSKLGFVSNHVWAKALIGGSIFGFGMVIAGGCVVGSIWRAGEGQVKLMLSIVGMLIAGPLTSKFIVGPFDDLLNSNEITALSSQYIPNIEIAGYSVGFLGAMTIILIVVLFWYIIAKWNERTCKFCQM